MRVNTKILVVTVASLFVLTQVRAAEMTYLGTFSCGNWVQAKQKGDTSGRFALRTWVTGFLSGAAITADKDVLDGIDEPSVVTWIDNYCSKNPLDKLVAAADALFTELTLRKLRVDSSTSKKSK